MNFGEWQQLSPEAAAREVLRRAESNLSAVQRRAVLATLPDESALAAAFAKAPAKSPLRGVPYVLKDLFDVVGEQTFAGSSFLPEVRPTQARIRGSCATSARLARSISARPICLSSHGA